MAQKKKKKTQPAKNAKKRISRNQQIMVIVGVFIIIAMMLPAILSFFQ
jgi:hypothetical protein